MLMSCPVVTEDDENHWAKYRKSIISDAILDAAIREWTALCDERRQAHVNELIYQLGKTLPTASHHIILQDTHVLAGDHMGNPSFLKSACPETFVGLLKELNDDHWEQHLSICHHRTSSNYIRSGRINVVRRIKCYKQISSWIRNIETFTETDWTL